MKNLVLEVESFVTSLLRYKLPHTFIYHNLGHTQRVLKSTKELIKGENIGEEDAGILLLAAWFHDVGYTEGVDNHEENSVKIASEFLKNKGAKDDVIDKVNKLIMSTKMGVEPENQLEKVLKDADNSHFGKKSYMEIGDLLREEWEQQDIKTYTDLEWIKENVNFFTQHHRFYSNYALDNWQQGKDKNLAGLFKRQKKLKQEEKKNRKKDEEFAFKKNKAILPERGIETMFRVTLRNHINLSDIADTKANILLSVNAIIVSLVLSNLLPKLDNASNAHLIYPTIVFVFFTIIAMILSVLATRPNVTSGEFTKDDVKNKKVNLLFFGNFHKMRLEDFEWAMGEMMKDKEYLYSSMSKDLYFLGLVLNRKYKILRLTYTIFIIGIVVSCAAFAIAFYLSEVQ
jgi:predicted metal-dependent HD superfamily phosphohydrolase